MSASMCGCDVEVGWKCRRHDEVEAGVGTVKVDVAERIERDDADQMVKDVCRQHTDARQEKIALVKRLLRDATLAMEVEYDKAMEKVEAEWAGAQQEKDAENQWAESPLLLEFERQIALAKRKTLDPGIGGAPTRATILPTDPTERKKYPVASGVLQYFPKALMEVARVSKAGNDQHHAGQPLHWDRTKSTDEADALIRHFLEYGTLDTDGMRHTAKVAWRALAMLEKELEAAEREDK